MSGPWKVTDVREWRENCCFEVSSASSASIFWLAKVGPSCDFEQARANAYLIAAAPDMYAALKATIRFMDDIYPADIFTGVSGDEGPIRVVELRGVVQQALAKAEGREVR